MPFPFKTNVASVTFFLRLYVGASHQTYNAKKKKLSSSTMQPPPPNCWVEMERRRNRVAVSFHFYMIIILAMFLIFVGKFLSVFFLFFVYFSIVAVVAGRCGGVRTVCVGWLVGVAGLLDLWSMRNCWWWKRQQGTLTCICGTCT